jgi:hypothetical protein
MTGVCPDCGSPLPEEGALLGLCPQCLLSMALEDDENQTLHGSSESEIVQEAVRRFLEARAPEIMSRFVEEDVEWGLRGSD